MERQMHRQHVFSTRPSRRDDHGKGRAQQNYGLGTVVQSYRGVNARGCPNGGRLGEGDCPGSQGRRAGYLERVLGRFGFI
jgi:hypothetical protein